MKRLALLCLLALGCHKAPATTTGPRIIAKSTGGPTYGSVDFLPSAASVSEPGMVRIANVGGGLQQSTNGAAFAPIGGGGSSLTAGSGISIDGGVVSNTAPFGADTQVKSNNDAGTPVTSLELVNSLTNATPGSEASQLVGKLLTGGAQSTIFTWKPGQLTLPNGTAAIPAYALTGNGDVGMYWDTSSLSVCFVPGNASNLLCFNGGVVRNTNAAGFFLIDADNNTGIEKSSTSDLQLLGTDHDVVIGADGALSTSATHGQVEVPTCAGAPTGTVTTRSGKASMVIDTTDGKLCWSTGGGTWKCVTGA